MQGLLGGQQQLLCTLCLSVIYVLAFVARLHPVLRFEAVIHEFDPYFNYRATEHLVDNGLTSFHNWFDPAAWYPLGRTVGFTVYPGLMWAAALVHWVLNALSLTVSVRHVCVFLAPWMASNSTIAIYLLGKELKDSHTGIIAAAFMALVPGYISRSVAGSFDNEGLAVFALLMTMYFFVKAVNTGSLSWGAMSALAYFLMAASWGGYVYVINLIPLYVIVLMLAGCYNHHVYIAYSSFYTLGTLMTLQIRFIGFQPVNSPEHLLALATFVMIQLHGAHEALRTYISQAAFDYVTRLCGIWLLVLASVATIAAQMTGWIMPWTGRFYSVLDPTYAKEHMPILASVSEHQPTSWASFFFDLHCLVFFFPAGLYYCFKAIKQESPKTNSLVFLVMFGMSSLYLAGVMVRLMLVLAPAACLLSAVAVSSILSTHLPLMVKDEHPLPAASKKNTAPQRKGPPEETQQRVATVMVAGIIVILFFFVNHCTWVVAEAYSSPSIVLSARQPDGSNMIFDDFREAYHWVKMNTEPSAKILSWWDYGYQISSIANRTTIVDNNTWNNTHIATVGKAFSANETVSYEILTRLGVDYVLVIFGGLVGYSSDDLNKFLWMVRIGSSVDPTINEAEYFSRMGEFRVDSQAPPKLLNSLLYKLCYYRFGTVRTRETGPTGVDRVRGTEIGNKKIELEHLEEAFSSEHWIVRIYKVKPPENRW